MDEEPTLFDITLDEFRAEWGTPYQQAKTSREAAEKIRPSVGTLRALVLDAITTAGRDGMTDHEVQHALMMNPSTQRPRRVELANGGFIEKKLDSLYNPFTRKTPSGRKAQVWIATGKS